METETTVRSCKACRHHRVSGDQQQIRCSQPRASAPTGIVFARNVGRVRLGAPSEAQVCEATAARCRYYQEER